MKGYQLSLFTELNVKHHGQPVGQWLFEKARAMGVSGATLVSASEGFGKAGRVHSSHFFELADQPMELILAVTEAECEKVMALLQSEGLDLFYIKTPIEFGKTGKA